MPLGTTIRELIEIAGGLRAGRKLIGVQPGGGSSACLFEEHLDLPYDYESMAKAGSMLGSGAIVVFDDTTDFVKAAHNAGALLRARVVRSVHAVPRGRQLDARRRSSASSTAAASTRDVDMLRASRTRSPA